MTTSQTICVVASRHLSVWIGMLTLSSLPGKKDGGPAQNPLFPATKCTLYVRRTGRPTVFGNTAKNRDINPAEIAHEVDVLRPVKKQGRKKTDKNNWNALDGGSRTSPRTEMKERMDKCWALRRQSKCGASPYPPIKMFLYVARERAIRRSSSPGRGEIRRSNQCRGFVHVSDIRAATGVTEAMIWREGRGLTYATSRRWIRVGKIKLEIDYYRKTQPIEAFAHWNRPRGFGGGRWNRNACGLNNYDWPGKGRVEVGAPSGWVTHRVKFRGHNWGVG